MIHYSLEDIWVVESRGDGKLLMDIERKGNMPAKTNLAYLSLGYGVEM
jgi:hypothetical protein